MSDLVGIDVGNETIKMVSISKDSNGLSLDAIGEVKNPRGNSWMNEESKNKGLEEVAVSIKSLLRDLKLKSKQVVVCLPEDQIISRLIHLPPLKESEIRDALKFEAETFIPYPLDEVSIDYEKIEEDEMGRLTVFVIAAKNSLIQSYVKLFKVVGLELVALESPAVAIRRLVNFSIPDISGKIVLIPLN